MPHTCAHHYRGCLWLNLWFIYERVFVRGFTLLDCAQISRFQKIDYGSIESAPDQYALHMPCVHVRSPPSIFQQPPQPIHFPLDDSKALYFKRDVLGWIVKLATLNSLYVAEADSLSLRGKMEISHIAQGL